MQGHIQRRVVIYSNDMQHNAVPLTLTAEVKPELQVEPRRIEIQFSADMQAQMPPLRLTNRSDRSLKLTRVRANVAWLRPQNIPQQIGSGAAVEIAFEIVPGADKELRNGYVIVETSGHGRSKVRIPVRVRLSPPTDYSEQD